MSRIIVDSIRNSSASSDGITLSSDGKVAFPNTSTGKILQVVQTAKTDTASFAFSSTNAYSDLTGMSVSITPSATSSKILVMFTVAIGGNSGSFHIRLLRGSTNIAIGDGSDSRSYSTISFRPAGAPYGLETAPLSHSFLDSPNTTSATTYKLQGTAGASYSTTWYLNRSQSDNNADYGGRPVSTITAIEVAA